VQAQQLRRFVFADLSGYAERLASKPIISSGRVSGGI
jgi:hypothetical protein